MPTHWEDHNDWNELNLKSIKRASDPLSGRAQLNTYGLGSERTLHAYQEWSGINFRDKTIKPNALRGEFGSTIERSKN